jgi:hypothetical protein
MPTLPGPLSQQRGRWQDAWGQHKRVNTPQCRQREGRSGGIQVGGAWRADALRGLPCQCVDEPRKKNPHTYAGVSKTAVARKNMGPQPVKKFVQYCNAFTGENVFLSSFESCFLRGKHISGIDRPTLA